MAVNGTMVVGCTLANLSVAAAHPVNRSVIIGVATIHPSSDGWANKCGSCTPGNKEWANECGACHTRIDISLRWGKGPTRSATSEAKWQVCTQACSPAVYLYWAGEVGKITSKLQTANCLARVLRVTTTQGLLRYESTRSVTINDNLIMFILYPLHKANNKVLFRLPASRHANRDKAYKANQRINHNYSC